MGMQPACNPSLYEFNPLKKNGKYADNQRKLLKVVHINDSDYTLDKDKQKLLHYQDSCNGFFPAIILY